jgi:stage II sporulation protein P
MMTMIKKVSAVLFALILTLALSPVAYADDWYLTPGGYYTVNLSDGTKLFDYAGIISVDDEYISGDNKLYKVVSVNDGQRSAVANYVQDVVLWEGFDDSMLKDAAAQQGQKKVGIYCSHTDESYIPGDGTEAKPDHGGIVDVANNLAAQLNKRGIKAVADDTSHDPHDAGAYRRSRSSAMNLMESEQPDLLLDIHRDGIPDASQYDDTINGQPASKCRFVVGRSNQSEAANLTTAKKMKQVADSTYPGLVKDIFIGHGSYNQDITPNSMLIEIGTHTIEKSRVMDSTGPIADVIAKYLGVSGAQPGQPGQPGQPQVQQQAQKSPEANRAAGISIAWIIGVVAAAGLVFLLIATVRGQRKERVGNFFREVTGIGHHRDKDDKDDKGK